MLAMQLIMNADPDEYGSLIGSYDQDFLLGENKYPKKNIDAYNLLKGWNKHKNPRGLTKGRLSFSNNGEEDSTTLAKDGSKSREKCARCGRNTHKTADCYAIKHNDETVLHNMDDIKEIEGEVKQTNESNEDVSSKLSSDFNTSYDIEL